MRSWYGRKTAATRASRAWGDSARLKGISVYSLSVAIEVGESSGRLQSMTSRE
jgi:hypothetical protein